MRMELFPYEPRPNQLEFIKVVEKVAEEGRHICLESGTGTGKTVCALTGCLQAALRTGKKVLYLTRTNSQERQVMLELRRINERHEVLGIAIQGRQVTCPLFKRDPDLKAGSPDELARLCREKKKKVLQGQEGGCRFFRETRLSDMDEITAFCRKTLPTAEEFVDFCDSKALCPHELMKELAREARVVTAPYAYFFMPFIRNSLIDWMDVAMEDLVVVVDEAHNLPEYTREVESFQMTKWSLEAAEKEIDEYGDPEVLDGVSIRDVTLEVKRLLDIAIAEYLIDEDGLIPPSFLEEGLMEAFTISSKGIATAAKGMMEQGEIVRERKVQESRLPRSYVHALGAFINFWASLEEGEYVKLVIGGDNPCFRAYCLDPVVTTSVLLGCGGSIHMSGTLSPLAEYRDSIGLPYDTALATFPSPFPPENKLVMYVEDVTSRYEELSNDENMVSKMEDHVVSICNVMDRNAVVFFPSYSMMDRFIADKILTRIKRKVHVEERGMTQADLMEIVSRFKGQRDEGAVLFAVMGGRISEGIDFPDKDLQVALIVGVPYPKPTAKQRALMHFYETKFRKGWEYTVKAPTYRKMAQAIGRLIRTETDVGAAVILDRRAKQFSDRMDMRETEEPVNELVRFFKEMAPSEKDY